MKGINPRQYLLPTPKPEQGVQDEPILWLALKGRGKLFYAVNFIVAHVEIDHFITPVRPDDRIITRMPNLVRFRSRPKGETRWIY